MSAYWIIFFGRRDKSVTPTRPERTLSVAAIHIVTCQNERNHFHEMRTRFPFFPFKCTSTTIITIISFSRIFINNILKYCHRFHICPKCVPNPARSAVRFNCLPQLTIRSHAIPDRDCRWFHLTLSMIYYSTAWLTGSNTTQMCISSLDQFDLPEQIEYSIFNAPTCQLRLELQIEKSRGISLIKRWVSNYKHNSKRGTGNVNKLRQFLCLMLYQSADVAYDKKWRK